MKCLPKTCKSQCFESVPALLPSSSLVAGSHSDKKSARARSRSFLPRMSRSRSPFLSRSLSSVPGMVPWDGTGKKAHKDFYSDLRRISCSFLPVRVVLEHPVSAECLGDRLFGPSLLADGMAVFGAPLSVSSHPGNVEWRRIAYGREGRRVTFQE